MHHGTCVTHVPWCMSGSLTCGDGENVPGIPGACAPAILRIWQEAHCQVSSSSINACFLWHICHLIFKVFTYNRPLVACSANSRMTSLPAIHITVYAGPLLWRTIQITITVHIVTFGLWNAPSPFCTILGYTWHIFSSKHILGKSTID